MSQCQFQNFLLEKKDYKRRGVVGIGKLLVEWFCHWKKDKVRRLRLFRLDITQGINCSFPTARTKEVQKKVTRAQPQFYHYD